MRVALISDTHGMLPSPALFRGADVIIHAGDIAQDRGQQKWYDEVLPAWCRAVGVPVHATAGNHDNPATMNMTHAAPNFHLHIDEIVEIGGQRVWFSPWSPRFFDWFWMHTEPTLERVYARIPEDTTVVVSHTPPEGMCDGTLDCRRVGSTALRDRVLQLPNLRWVICGHIHAGRGGHREGGFTVLNVATVDEWYKPVADPITWVEW